MSARNTLGRFGLVLSAATILVGCTLGDSGDGDGDGDGDIETPDRIPNPEPGEDDRLDQLGIVCESTLLVTGTFVEGVPQPPDRSGCWEVGTWTVDMIAVDFQGCDPQPDLDMTFVYEITFDEEEAATNIVYLDDPDNERVNLKVTTNGSGDCLGGFEHFGLPGVFPDDVLLQLHPDLMAGGSTLQGIGAFAWYEEDPF
jgi:hypothetical protein